MYAIAEDGSAVFRYRGHPDHWDVIGGPADRIFAGPGCLCATNPDYHDLWLYEP